MSRRRRLDAELLKRGLVESRTQAQELIEQGKVLVSGTVAANAARQVSPGEPINVAGPPPRFVSRGGEKLDAALEYFKVDVTGAMAIDVGASTGGFTDCLLQRGAASVVALDVGHGQLHEKLRGHPQVSVVERTNIRHVTIGQLGGTPFDVIVVDVSFISLRTIGPVISGSLARPGTELIALIKPQFEAGKVEVSKTKGVVRDQVVWRRVLFEVLGAMTGSGAATMGLMVSPLVGAEGNVEFLAHLRPHVNTADMRVQDAGPDIDDVVAEATNL